MSKDTSAQNLWTREIRLKFREAYTAYNTQHPESKDGRFVINVKHLWRYLAEGGVSKEFILTLGEADISREVIRSAWTGNLCENCKIKFAFNKYAIGNFCKECFQLDEVRSLRKNRRTSRVKAGIQKAFKEKRVEIVAKRAKTCLERYGYSNPSQVPEINERQTEAIRKAHSGENRIKIRTKTEATNLKRHGCRVPAQNADVRSKMLRSSYRVKKVLVGSKEFLLQGYEPQALNKFIERYGSEYVERNFLCEADKEFEPIPYGNHTYSPDLYSKASDTYYEIKSLFTLFDGHWEPAFETNRTKAKIAHLKGYKVVWLILNARGNAIKLPERWYTASEKELRSRYLNASFD